MWADAQLRGPVTWDVQMQWRGAACLQRVPAYRNFVIRRSGQPLGRDLPVDAEVLLDCRNALGRVVDFEHDEAFEFVR